MTFGSNLLKTPNPQESIDLSELYFTKDTITIDQMILTSTIAKETLWRLSTRKENNGSNITEHLSK